MEVCEEQRSCGSISGTCESTEVSSSKRNPPHAPPPYIPPPPCRNKPVGSAASADASEPSPATVGKEEILEGIKKLLAWIPQKRLGTVTRKPEETCREKMMRRNDRFSWGEESQKNIQEKAHGIRGMCNEQDDTVWIASNRHTAPILQQGPECGIVALCMAVNMLGPVSADKTHILKTAKEKQFTIQGEMFSATNLLELAFCCCGVSGEVLAGNMTENRKEIILHLANGWPVLVPYDKDGNCEPCCLRGHKAHWAVISGFLLQCSSAGFSDLKKGQDTARSNLYCISSDNPDRPSDENIIRTVETALCSLPACDVYLLARQGKSTHVRPWRYNALADSNSNLVETGSSIQADLGKFVIPEGGIRAGLCSKVILIKP